ncbi:hypothetical protein ITX31_11825 [Arthrobacter gandavensis]|uniref:hypothetical protein n=1 Tax=Arthrobacter gandavensis TaxID=169960 RepID=UPI00188E341E|nr:hypothetical protein [Arthrobacter gandavensis]MBF4994795.1 hypothetical protein [Arthrobacter gandavensis]
MEEETGGDTPKPDLTGDPAVDQVLSGLADAGETPVGEHAALYGALHDGLLAALNEEPGRSPDPVPGAGSASGPRLPSGGAPGPVPRPEQGHP